MTKAKQWTHKDRTAALDWIERKAKTSIVFVGQDATAEDMLPRLASITELPDFAEATQAALTQAAWNRLLGALRQRKHHTSRDKAKAAISQRPQHMIEADQIFVTPLMASEWLKRNNVNRRLRGWWVKALASIIERGEWVVSHQGIAFAQSGHLIDGQHRLEAIVESGIAVECMVFRDVPDDAFRVLDAGVKRNLSDLTGLSTRCAQVCRLAAEFAQPGTGKMNSQFIAEISRCGVGELHESLISRAPTNVKYFTSAAFRLAAILLIMDGRDERYVMDVYSALSRQDYDELPGIAKSCIRQVMTKALNAVNSVDTLARAIKVLAPENKTQSMLKLSNEERKASVTFVKAILAGALAKQRELDRSAWSGSDVKESLAAQPSGHSGKLN